MDGKVKTLVPLEEENSVMRAILSWLNTSGDKPDLTLNYERLDPDKPGLALSTIQGTYKTRKYLYGGYEAQYQFKIIYRLQPGNSNDRRLKADEALDKFGAWAVANVHTLNLGDDLNTVKIDINARSALFAAYDGGDEDHQILMTLTYERT